MNNYICVKYSMAPQAYKVVSTHSNEISGWKITSRILHSHAPRFGGINGDFQSDISTLAFKNGEKLEDFHSIIMRLQQEIILYEGTAYPTISLFQYTKVLSKIDKLK